MTCPLAWSFWHSIACCAWRSSAVLALNISIALTFLSPLLSFVCLLICLIVSVSAQTPWIDILGSAPSRSPTSARTPLAWIPSDRFIWIGPSRRGAPRIGPSMLGFALDLSRARPLRSSRSELGDRPSPAIGHHVARPNLCFHRSGDPALVARLFWLSANHIGHTQLDSSALGVLTGQMLKRRLRRDGHLRGVHRCILHLYFTGRGNQPPLLFFVICLLLQ